MRRGPTVFLVLAVTVAFLAALMLRHQLGAVVFAAMLGYLLQPVYKWLLAKVKKPIAAGGIVLLGVTAMLMAPFILLALAFMDDAVRIANSIESRQDVRSRIEEMLSSFGLSDSRVEQFSARIIDEGGQYLQQQLVPVATMAAEFLVSLVVFYILLYYVLVDGPKLAAWLERVLPAPESSVESILHRVGVRVKAIALGTFFVSIVQGVLAGLGWWILGLPAPVFWGVVMLLLSVIPVIGAFVVLIPASIWSFANGDIVAGVGLLVLNFIMVGLIDDLLRPYLIGTRSGVHPSLILLGIVGGLPLFGIAGIVLGPLLMGMLAPFFEAWADPGKKGSDNSS